MSIYSGFVTWKHEEVYNRLLYRSIEKMAELISNVLKEDDMFVKSCLQIYRLVWMIAGMEEQKHLEPNFSKAFWKLYFASEDKYKFD